jgi:uncharacterized membrane protein YhaH (DUF805 family)
MSDWHIQLNGQSKGPYSDDQLKVLCETGVVNASTATWKSDYSSWKPLAETDFAYKSLLAPPPLTQSVHTLTHSAGGEVEECPSLWHYFVHNISDKYATFQGRASRKEYWAFVLFWWSLIAALVLSGIIFDSAAGNIAERQERPVITAAFFLLFSLCTLIPGLAVTVRRFHDVGLTGWLVLLVWIPYVGEIFLLVVGLLPSEIGTNKHGPSVTRRG